MGRRRNGTLEDVDELLESGFARYYTDPGGALQSAEEGGAILDRTDDPFRRGRVEMLAACALELLSRSEEAIARGREAVRLFLQTDSPVNRGNALNVLGICQRSLARYSDAMQSFRDAHRIFSELEDSERAAAAHNNIGSVYEMIGDFENALAEYLEALSYYRRNENRRNEGLVAGNIGNIYYAMEDYEKAREWHGRALVLSQEVEDRLSEATLRLNICSTLRKSDRLEEALETLAPALEIVREQGHRRLEGAVLDMRGALLQQGGDRSAALENYREAAGILKEVGAEREYADTMIKMAGTLEEEEEGVVVIEEALEILERIGERSGMITALETLAALKESRGDHAAALEAMHRAYRLYGEVKGEEREQGVTKLKARFDVAEKERERLEYERRAVEQAALVEERSRELNSTAMLLIKKNSLLQQIRNDLEEYRKKEEEGSLARAFSRIDEGLRSDDDWQRFEETYRLVHHDFIARLSARFPELSPTELKVAALLHINLSNKEIADLLCISLRTIESHRYNIRKKLDLPGSSNLAIQIGQRLEQNGEAG